MHFEYRILSTPCSVIRDVTLKAIHTLDKAKGSSSKDHRIVLHGRAGSGKSFLLHQAVQYAQAQGWVVLYIPRAVTLVNSTNSYAYDIRTQTYLQPRASYLTLDKLYKANSALLSQLTLSRELVTEKLNIPAGTTLAEVAQAGIKDKSFTSGPVVLETVLKELETQTKFPVLVAVDDFQALFHNSAYKDPFFQAIRPHHLSLPRTFLEFASGQRTLANGVFMGALTESDTAYAVPLELKDALNLESRHPVSPYDKRDQVKLGYTEGLKGLKVPERMSTNEMAGLFSVWKDDMALTTGEFLSLFEDLPVDLELTNSLRFLRQVRRALYEQVRGERRKPKRLCLEGSLVNIVSLRAFIDRSLALYAVLNQRSSIPFPAYNGYSGG
jgi:small subunit ribosomal protein S29